jgi:RNA polymerase sigma-70 factor (ECF subfamily)
MTKTLDSQTEHHLIAKVKKGDERAFAQLVKQYEQTVYGFAFKLCRDKDKAEESFQDTFINVYRKIDQFDSRSKFSTWLYTIVANNCLMNRRKRKLDGLLESLDDTPDVNDEQVQKQLQSWNDSPIETLMNKELRKTMDDAIQELPDEYKVVFVLRDLENRTAEETAKILKLSVPAVKSRLRRSRMFLRHKLHEVMQHH